MQGMKVMTDEQIEILRIQIAAYVSISQKLAEMHTMLILKQDPPGVKLENTYTDDSLMIMHGGSHRLNCRKRWAPTPKQLEILESTFRGNGTPSKQKIRDITTVLSQHGQISETNVYIWFQNRRARSKKKQKNNVVVVLGHDGNQPQNKKPPVASLSKDNHGSVLGGIKLQ